MPWFAVLLVSLAACGRLGFEDAPDAADAAVPAIDRVCTTTLPANDISVGRDHICAITGDAVYCWGDNAHGDLGLGDTTRRVVPTFVGGNFTSLVNVRGDHSCAMAGTNLTCWGANGDGQVGVGTTMDVLGPVVVGSGWSYATGGLAHTCGHNGSDVFCWGANDRGQLGLGDRASRSLPAMVPAQAWIDVVADDATTYAVITLGIPESLSFWGAKDADTANDTLAPNPAGCCDYAPHPSGRHRLANHAGANMVAWGANEHGQLGLGNTVDTSAFNLVPGAWVTAAGGEAHSCAIGTTNALSCWGKNDRGQLGIGTPGPDVLDPTQVGTDTDWKAVYAGGNSTCAVKTDGRLFCWGANDRGQLGIGHTTDRSSPVQTCLVP